MTEATNPYQPPRADVSMPMGSEKQDLKTLYTSFQGRVPRKVFWMYGVLLMTAIAFVVFAVIALISMASGVLGTLLAIPAYIAFLWASLAIQVKRWHDRNKSGWWVLIGFIPVIGAIWAFIETGCLRGTEGSNEYGDDPTDQY